MKKYAQRNRISQAARARRQLRYEILESRRVLTGELVEARFSFFSVDTDVKAGAELQAPIPADASPSPTNSDEALAQLSYLPSLVRESFRGTAYQPLDLTAAIDAVTNVTTTNSTAQSMLTGDSLGENDNAPGAGLGLVNSTNRILLDQFRADSRFAGIDGTGFSTVIIDSGIDLNHPHFGPDANGNGIADRIVYQQSLIGGTTADDLNGHGTHVSATVASSDSVYKGMAPSAGIIALQTNNASGSGPFSAVEQALQWTIANATTYNIASVNMSLGDGGNYTETVALYGIGDELAALAALDVIVVSSSGNDFGTFGSPGVGYPSADPNSMSIGSRQTNNFQVSGFSQRHPEMTSVFAPGDPIVAAAIGGGVRSLNGTSMASPHVSGIAVLMQQLATRELGRRLRPTEFETLVRAAGMDLLLIPSTGASYQSMDVLSLGESILAMKNSTIDIRGASFNVNDLMVRGQSGTASITLGNTGTTASGPVKVNVYLSVNGNISTTGDIPLGSVTVANVPAGGTSGPINVNFTLPVPNDPFWRSSTSYTIGAVIDGENLIGEADENNNFGRGAGFDLEAITITNPPSDLRGVSFAVRPTATERGLPITVDYAIENIGIGPTNGTTVAFYMSQDGIINPANDLLLGTTQVASILAGQSSGPRSFGLVLPINAHPIWSTLTNFTIGMVVDSSSTESESNETNNFGRGLGLDSAAMTITPPPTRIRGTVFHDANNNSVYNGPFNTTVVVERAIQGASLRPGVTTILTFADLPANISGATMRFRGVGDFDEVTEYANIVIDGLITTRVFDKEPLTPSGAYTNVDETISLTGTAWQAAMLDGELSVVVTFNNPGSFSTGSANYLRVTLEYDAKSHDQYHVASAVENRVLDTRPTNVTLATTRPSLGDATLTLMALGDVGGTEETATINLEGLATFTVFDLVDTGADNAEAIQSVTIPKATLDLLMADGVINANLDFNAAVNALYVGNFFQIRLDYPIQSELGVAGKVLSIDTNDDGSVEGTVTTIADDPSTALNEAGQYEFSGVASGANRVRLSVAPDAVATVPASGNQLVNLIVGEVRESVNFGFFDQTVPDLVALSPLDNALAVPLAAPLILQFDEAITAGTGSIVIRRSADLSIFESLNIRGTTVVFSGNTVTAAPSLAFVPGTQYYVEIIAGTIVDLVGKSWAGVSGVSAWNFTTVANQAPTALSLSANSIAENVPAGSTVGTLTTTDPDISSTFIYSLVAGSGSTDNSTFAINGNALTINISPDFEVKSSYTVRVRSTDQGGLFIERIFVISITDVTPTFSINDVTVTEGNNVSVNAVFTVTRSADSGQSVTVSYATANNTAVAPGDYTSTSGTLTFAPSETSKTIQVQVIGETLNEGNETFFVNLTSPTNATITDNQGQGTITDDESVAVILDLASLAVGQGTTIFGAETLDQSGVSVSNAGDFNGDGFDDVLIGAFTADAAGNAKLSAGDSYLVFGGPSLPATVDLANLGSAGITLFGAEIRDFSGTSVSCAGDVNGDGFDDLLIGALSADASGNTKSYAGDSYVIFGAVSPPATINLANLGSSGITIFGADAGDRSGISVSNAGDVNGDGFDDLIIGSYLADAAGNAKSEAGDNHVIFGAASLPATIDLANLGTAGVTIFGADAGDRGGRSVSSAGDVNGDGFDDLFIGANLADSASNAKLDAGDSYLIFGAASLPATIDLANLGAVGLTIVGAGAGDQSGISVSNAGDVNGDGFDDLLIGAYRADAAANAKLDAGESYLIFGASMFPATIDLANLGSVGITIYGADVGDLSGRSVSSAGDVNGDGFDDLLIGANAADASGNAKSSAGDSHLIFGSASLPATIDLANLGSAGIAIFGADANDISGTSVSSAGDVNGDGFDDLIIGARYGDASGNAKSAAGDNYVIFGGDFTGSVTHQGTALADTLTGSASANVMNGSRGNDILIGHGGTDVLRGGIGNDILAVSDLNFKRIVGGNGSDTLRLDGSGFTLDLTSVRDNRIVGIEQIDITGSGNNTLTLTAREVLNISDDSNTLIVRRNAGDTVNIGSGWTQGAAETIGPDTFDVYTQGRAIVKVQRASAIATIAARNVFYNNATGSNLSSVGAANNAIASDKNPLLPGNASTFANYTNYSRGLNGIIVDVNNLPAATTDSQILASLQFARWNGIDPAGFVGLPGAAVPTATILAGNGAGGSARVKITFPDNTLQNTWLRVTVLANADTALAANDVFYFGNVMGELDFGNTATRLRVNGQDAALLLANQSPGANSAGVTNKFDLDRNGRVNGQDYAFLLANQQPAGIVAPITAPSARSAFVARSSSTSSMLGDSGNGQMPSILSSIPSAASVSLVDAIPTIGPRWTVENYDVIRDVFNSDQKLPGQVVDSMYTGMDDSKMRNKRLDYDVLPSQVDGYFARFESELDHVCFN